MSMCYWVCEGIGIKTDDIYNFLDKKKCIDVIKQQFPDEEVPSELDFDIDDYMYGKLFDNLGDFLCHCDDTNTFTYGDNGEGEYYFYYAPSFPWYRQSNEPKSIEEVHDRIVAAVQRVCNMSRDEIENIIDDNLYEEGWE